jgi:signal transduction histidine kinase
MGTAPPLLATICHDLRTPLAAVTMGATFILQATPDDGSNARERRILQAMLRSCAQMERLIRNFADLSEVERGAVALDLADHTAGEIADLAAGAASDSAVARQVTLDVAKPAGAITLRCDRVRVLRALGQLLENAVNASPSGSTVTIVVEERGENVAFVVADKGPGLSLEVRENLFDRAWHAKRGKGAFGLAIVRGFAEAHGGELVVGSPELGARMSLIMPKGGPTEPQLQP